MHLHPEETGKLPVGGIIIRHITHQHAIDVVLHMVALYYHPVIIPIIVFDPCFKDGRIVFSPWDARVVRLRSS